MLEGATQEPGKFANPYSAYWHVPRQTSHSTPPGASETIPTPPLIIIGCEFRVITWFVVWGAHYEGGDVLFTCSTSLGKPLTFLGS